MNSVKKLSMFILIPIMTLSIIFGGSVEKAEAANNFKDVPYNISGYEDIISLANDGIISGYPDNTYRPYNNLTRAQGAIIIGRALNIDVNQPKNHTFKDVNKHVSGYEYIYALTNKGIFNKADKFHPTAPLTRAQMAKVLVLSFDLKGNSTKHFKDVSKNNMAYNYIQTLVATGITTGTSTSTFSPNQTVTRVQMASFVNRTLKSVGNSDNINIAKEDTFIKMADKIFTLTNKERTSRGLPALKRHKGIEKLSMIKAQDLYDNNYFEHESPVYGRAFDMMKKDGIKYRYAGENIAFGYTSAKDVVQAWMDSPGHRKNILDKNFTHIGIGYYEPEVGKSSDKKMVQMFIQPK